MQTASPEFNAWPGLLSPAEWQKLELHGFHHHYTNELHLDCLFFGVMTLLLSNYGVRVKCPVETSSDCNVSFEQRSEC